MNNAKSAGRKKKKKHERETRETPVHTVTNKYN